MTENEPDFYPDELPEVSGRLLVVEVLLSELFFFLQKTGAIKRGQLENILDTTDIRIDMICHDVESKATLPSATTERIRQRGHLALNLMRRDVDDKRKAISQRLW